MSGHSKWAQIKHKKASTDAKRAKLFAKLSRAITVAAKERGDDPEMNPSLADAVARARAVNVPSDNIARAIKRGGKDSDERLESFLYEAYGPGGIAMLMTGITDNTNRSSNEIRHLLAVRGGKWATPGSVTWAFEQTDDGWEPKTYACVTLSESDTVALDALTDALEDHDDIQEIYTNATPHENLGD